MRKKKLFSAKEMKKIGLFRMDRCPFCDESLYAKGWEMERARFSCDEGCGIYEYLYEYGNPTYVKLLKDNIEIQYDYVPDQLTMTISKVKIYKNSYIVTKIYTINQHLPVDLKNPDKLFDRVKSLIIFS
jgi:hypothetical protein